MWYTLSMVDKEHTEEETMIGYGGQVAGSEAERDAIQGMSDEELIAAQSSGHPEIWVELEHRGLV